MKQSTQTLDWKTECLLERLDKVKNTGLNKWLACCPAHSDKHPSLGIKQIDDKIIIHCFAGCHYADVLAAIGFEASDLFPDKTTNFYRPKKPAPKFNKSELFDLLVIEAVILALCFQAINNKVASEVDCKRAEKAFEAIMRLHSEVYR
ncbi:MAG: CHC2 zinc finger domain-containing protein [Methylomonas sp.]|jgi:hypothetical protein|uniref:CHC2 zinc finger domain-containing protein n=1 Tax=Methylomonas sp. TaxID=418 RepID=UPI0025EFD769|nr:CHC2 zinc finger domain-containing protein [Methylomonas sp.]MCK9606731.1 CHC2 zinc finger domain-containing protein [Methylomonas sp.]